jgi:hypothetical protein
MLCAAMSVDLFWLPLGAGGRSVRLNGRAYEAVDAALGRRPRRDLYHAALLVRTDAGTSAIEMTPTAGAGDGAVASGAVGSRLIGRSKLFRYDVRCRLGGRIPDLAEAVDSPRVLTEDSAVARRLLELVPLVPAATWGRDELRAGEMWTSNSVVAWLLVSAGVDVSAVRPPAGGRAPGWDAGVAVATRADDEGSRTMTRRTPAALYGRFVRRPVLTWGATADEADARLPGDELLENADGVATRAITIDAPASAVWPWIAQMGPSPRGGAYTYDWIENLLGLDMHSVDRVLPEFQHPEVGDGFGLGANRMRYARVEPGRVLAIRSADGNWVWAFVLEERDGRTRLLSRNRFRLPRLRDRIGMVPMEPASLVMERRMLRGIKERAELLAGNGRPEG